MVLSVDLARLSGSDHSCKADAGEGWHRWSAGSGADPRVDRWLHLIIVD